MTGRARARATLGTWPARVGRSADAAEPLGAARVTFTEIGATRWLRELDDATGLRGTG